MKKQKLDNLRQEIDIIDTEIIRLLSVRFSIAAKIGQEKKMMNKPPKDINREKEMIADRIKKGEESGISKNLIKKIWQEIHDYSVQIQSK